MNTLELVYTGKGRQRIIPIKDLGTIAFELNGAPEGSQVQFTNDSEEDICAGEGTFMTLSQECGVLAGATSMRVIISDMPESGFAMLTIKPVEDPELGCIGQLTNMNHVLAYINHDLRTMAVIAGA